MALVSIFPAIGATAYDEDGDPILPIGIQVTWSPYYASLMRQGLILFDDPLEQLTQAAAVETLYGSQTVATSTADLDIRTGAFEGAVVHAYGSSIAAGGSYPYIWDEGSSATADDVNVIGSTASGRWFRSCRGATNVRFHGARADGVTNDTAAIQAALNTGLDVEFPPGTYLCSNLTQTTSLQRIYCVGGVARLIKNANGVILTSSGNYVKLENIEFRGEAASPTYTGHNAVFSGTEPTLRHCGSMWAYARALLCTGQHVTIDGTCSIYQTTDSTSAGFDIEIGVSGTATLYHVITGIRSTQSTGGIKLVETGASSISDSEFGKLTCSKGTAAAGSGGPRVIGNRITGAQTTDQANGVYVGNQCAGNVTFEAGTSSNYFGFNVMAVGATITNSGNANNHILKEVSAGSTNQLRFGDDTSLAVITADCSGGHFSFPKNVRVTNGQSLQLTDTGGAYTGALSMTVGNNLSLAHTYASGALQLVSTNGLVQLIAGTGLQLTGTTSGVQCLSYLTRLSSVSVTASGTQTQAAGVALAITADYINVATCAIANDAIALPAAAVGREVTVTNSGIATLQIFPFTSDNLGAGVNASVTLAAGATARWWAIDSTTWKRIV